MSVSVIPSFERASGGTGVPLSLHNQKVLGLSHSSALEVRGCFLSGTISEFFFKGHGVWCPVYGTLHIKEPLPFFKKSRVVIPVAGFS